MSNYLEALMDRMERSGIARRSALVGCSNAEIAALEESYSVQLPQSYRAYLEVMGHNSGLLFRCDHMAVTYPYVMDRAGNAWTRFAREAPAECLEIPGNAFVIASRLSEQFEYILCNDVEDSPVWSYALGEDAVQEEYPSVLSWLEAWCDRAEEAIKSGYFARYPNGTFP